MTERPYSPCEVVLKAMEIMIRGAIEQSATDLGATPADIPGLWNAPGYPELTTGQLVQIAMKARGAL